MAERNRSGNGGTGSRGGVIAPGPRAVGAVAKEVVRGQAVKAEADQVGCAPVLRIVVPAAGAEARDHHGSGRFQFNAKSVATLFCAGVKVRGACELHSPCENPATQQNAVVRGSKPPTSKVLRLSYGSKTIFREVLCDFETWWDWL
jgi:hypothetical protein